MATCTLCLAVIACDASGPHTHAPDRVARAETIIAALATGDSEAFEAAARQHYSSSFLAQSTAERRREFLQRVHSDFGEIEILKRSETPDNVRIVVATESDMEVTFAFEFADGEDARVSGLGIMVGGGPDTGSEIDLPPLDVSPEMSAPEMRTKLDEWIGPIAKNEDFAGVVLVGRNGTPYVTLAYGYADRDRRIPADPAVAYNIASIGKKITQAAVAKLIQDGEISLDSTVGELLPDYPNEEAHSATVDQLVNHRGGIADFFGPDFDALSKGLFDSNHAYYDYVSAQPHRFIPGARSEYCNGCFIVLGEIIERVAGAKFEAYVQENVLVPAGMHSTGYFRRDRQTPPVLAVPYTREGGAGRTYHDASEKHGMTGSAAGGLYSTVNDLLAFDSALREGRLVDARRSAWVLGGEPQEGRNPAEFAFAGGASGVNAVMHSAGEWCIIVLGNVDEPVPVMLGSEMARQLIR